MYAVGATGVISAGFPAAALTKYKYPVFLASSLDTEHDASTSPTLCGQTEDPCKSNCVPSNVHSREISFVDIDPTEINITQALGGRSSETIECLRINGCRMNSAVFAAVVDELCLLELPNLHTIDISKNKVGGPLAGNALAKLLTHATSTRFLSLGWNCLALADLKDICLPICGVISLDLRSNPLSNSFVRPSSRSSSRSSSRRNPKSESADASVDTMAWVSTLVSSMPQLTHIHLAQASISDKELTALFHALTRPSTRVEYIGLEWLGLGSRLATLRAIMSSLTPAAGLATHSSALHVNLAANNLGDCGVEIISTSDAKLPSLTLACNFITERGTGMLAKWLPASSLTALDLTDNYFGDQGIVSLLAVHPGVKPNSYYTQIKSLGLNSCCLGDTSLRMLADAISCKWAPLESLRILRNSRMSSSAKITL
ncbi:hypothetical protein BX661DRAFT_176821 [Kickxella alabastrina]|uniref:uncharacterized protein n=1 Tax=Kickxella alabastrina TaxID=61397 RepID=UPI00221F0966|nr:uncharacterized protein BX661DRAFT_176821 [Kickxella alabastrina]KAI7834218.1 hypothetical protein BX661DRAFT_176821 [Kickxella alabastrina]